MSRILVIPHVLCHPVRIRELEIARALQEHHEVVVVSGLKQPSELSVPGKLKYHLSSLRGGRYDAELARLPRMEFRTGLADIFNSGVLNHYLRSGRFDAVLNAGFAPDVHLKPPPGVKYLLDVVDDHEEGARVYGGRSDLARIKSFYRTEFTRASKVIAVSQVLADRLKERWGVDAQVIPNGFWPESFDSLSEVDVRSLRERIGIVEGFVFGYIGGMDPMIDVSAVLEAFRRVRKAHPDTALVWIGGGARYLEFRSRAEDFRKNGVYFVGPVVPEESAKAVKLFDVGLLPKVPDRFTGAMMPIKVLEYAAAKIPVMASSLEELTRLGFPFVSVLPLEAGAWATKMSQLRTASERWNPSWAASFSRYSWRSVARRVETLL